MTHRELPASGRGCFAAVVIVPIAAFAGLMAITTLLTAHEDQAAGPPFGLLHPTRVSQTAPLETEESEDPPAGTLAAQPLALRNPDKPTTTVTVPSTVVATSSTTTADPTMSTPCPVRTTPAQTTVTTTSLPPTSTTAATATTTTVVPTTTTTVTTTTTTTTTSPTSTSNSGVPK